MRSANCFAAYERLRCVGPYVLIELLLPGGTLLALLLWLFRGAMGQLAELQPMLEIGTSVERVVLAPFTADAGGLI